jgi:Skp family chaperone for outer membrane proteins
MELLVALVSGILSFASPQAGDRIATIRLRAAVLSTADGMNAAATLKSKWTPEQDSLTASDAELRIEREKLNLENKRPLARMPWTRKRQRSQRKKLALDVTQKQKELKVRQDRDQEYFQREQQRIVTNLIDRMRAVLEAYAKENGYAAILDSDDKQSSVVASVNDVTSEIIKRYDQIYPVE